MEDGIDSSKDAGKLMISVLSAVAEIERENIRVQTMEGRIQKAREGKKWQTRETYIPRIHHGFVLNAQQMAVFFHKLVGKKDSFFLMYSIIYGIM